MEDFQLGSDNKSNGSDDEFDQTRMRIASDDGLSLVRKPVSKAPMIQRNQKTDVIEKYKHKGLHTLYYL